MDLKGIGRRLRELRERKKLSLRALARETGVAVSFLSGLERGRTNVSVATLKSILDVLGTTLGEFFSGMPKSSHQVVYRSGELTEILGKRKGISFKEVAAARKGRSLQLLIERYAPGAETGPESYRHNAEEAGVILKGTLELTVDGEVYLLKPGDAYYFDSRLPHRYRNIGKVTVHAVSVNTPPSF